MRYENEELAIESDEEIDSECLVFDAFCNFGGASGIKEMCNFNASKFHEIYNLFSDFFRSVRNVGPVCKSNNTGKGLFFMNLVVLKHTSNSNIAEQVLV